MSNTKHPVKCTRCGTECLDYRQQGEEKLCICCVWDVGYEAARAQVRDVLCELLEVESDVGMSLDALAVEARDHVYAMYDGLALGIVEPKHPSEWDDLVEEILADPTALRAAYENARRRALSSYSEGYEAGRASLLESGWDHPDQWAASPYDDFFDSTEISDSREKAISEATCMADHGDSIHVTRIRWRDPAELVCDHIGLDEQIAETMASRWSQEINDYVTHRTAKEAKEELRALLVGWARRHGPRVWEGIGKTEEVQLEWCPGECGDLLEHCECSAATPDVAPATPSVAHTTNDHGDCVSWCACGRRKSECDGSRKGCQGGAA